MKVQCVYIDTSVLGGCFDAAFAPWSNRLLADMKRGLFIPLLSDIVAVEMSTAPAHVQALYAGLLADHAEVLSVTAPALELADQYQQRGISRLNSTMTASILPLRRWPTSMCS